MNRALLKLLAALWFVIAFALAAFMVYGIRKEAFPFPHYDFLNYFSDDEDDGHSDVYDKTSADSFTISYNADEVRDFKIKLVSEKLIVKEADDAKVTVVVVSRRSEQLRPRVKLSGTTLEIYEPSEYRKAWHNRFGQEIVTLYLPSGYQADSVDADIVSGEVTVSSLSADEVKVVTISGAIAAENCTVRSLRSDTTSGSITYDGVLRSFNCHSISGAIKIASSQMLAEDSSAETVSGAVKVVLPENEGFTLRYNTISGRVHDDFTGSSIDRGSGGFTYKSNGPIISFKTVSGGISFEK